MSKSGSKTSLDCPFKVNKQNGFFYHITLMIVLIIKISALISVLRIRMNPHGFGLLDPHPESAFQMRIPDADADPG
jgi:hypothetical protein